MKKLALSAIAFVVSFWVGGLVFVLWVTKKWEDTTRDVMP